MGIHGTYIDAYRDDKIVLRVDYLHGDSCVRVQLETRTWKTNMAASMFLEMQDVKDLIAKLQGVYDADIQARQGCADDRR